MTFRGQKSPAVQGAFTLVEVLVGATLSAAVMAAVFSSYIYLGRSLARLANQQILETEARRTLGYFIQDVQTATGLTDTANLSATRVSLTVPSATGINTVTYYYNNTATAASVTINGTSVTMPATSLTRCVYDGSTVTAQTVLRNITDNNDGTAADLSFRYHDSSGSEYTSYADYLPGIKQLSVQFATQLGTSANGTQTLVHQVASNRVILRNRGYLP